MQLRPLVDTDLPALVALEQAAHAHPWQHRHFADCLTSGYALQGLWAGTELMGYWVAMTAPDEVHLLNLAVAPVCQRQGVARLLLQTLQVWARMQGAQWLWLEVRESNTRAIHLYKAAGFRWVSTRKGYYPAPDGQRENAWVMHQSLNPAGDV
jgi:ribosomal-protein-alanine N-acetyltransferase